MLSYRNNTGRSLCRVSNFVPHSRTIESLTRSSSKLRRQVPSNWYSTSVKYWKMEQPLAAPASALAPWRERLVASKVFMRYDYAWKDAEFQQAEHRITGISSRLLYLHASWVETYNHTTGSSTSGPRTKVYIESNGFPEFQEQVAKACKLMVYDTVADPLTADLVFVYVAPPGERRSDESPYKTFQAVVESSKTLPNNEKPMFCFLLGDADFLPLPKTEEDENLRGLSDFAISQEFAPIAREADYGSVAQFAVEFVPSSAENLSDEFKDLKTMKLDSMMSRFGCVGQNLMHHNEKWEFYAPSESVFCHGEEDPNGVTHPGEEDTLFWFKEMKGKTCDQCHAPSEKLFKCSRCRDAVYCSRECQKEAWKLHKRLCGKTHEQISANNEKATK